MSTVSVRDVAHRAGVSLGTVSNALNQPERVSPLTLERVQSAITDLGFVRNDAARQLRAGSSRTIGMVLLDATNPFFSAMASGAEDEAMTTASNILLANSRHDSTREAQYISLFEEQRVTGLLISPVGDIHDRLVKLSSRGVPAVLVDRRADPGHFSSVSVDDVHGGRLAVAHLVATGHRRLAFVGGGAELRQVADRLVGARIAAEEAGAAMEVIGTPELDVLAGRAAAESLLRRPARDIPDGVFCANDLLATGFLHALVLDQRFSVPHDIALIGYDDIEFARTTVVPLSSIRQPAGEIGRTAVRLLASERGRRHEHVLFKPELIIRDSTSG